MKSDPQQYANNYKLHFQLGWGTQANVYLGSKEEKPYAIKVYRPGFQDGFKREIRFLQNLKFKYLVNIVDSHPNAAVKLNGSLPEKRCIIVLEFGWTNFLDFLNGGDFPPEVCRTLIKQIIDSVQFLDKKGVCHRDIKPENIIISQDLNLKLIDFGSSTFSEGPNKDGKLQTKVGTKRYRPPQMQKEGKQYTGLGADMFAVGVILFMIYTKKVPFDTTVNDPLYNHIKKNKHENFWKQHEKRIPAGFCSDSFKSLINEFFSYDPTNRPTFESLSKNEWMTGPTLDEQKLAYFMKERLEEMVLYDEKMKDIADVRYNLVLQEMQNNHQDEDAGSNNRGSNGKPEDIKIFLERLMQYNNLIQVNNLPEKETGKYIIFVKQEVGFLIAFLNDYIDECQRSNQTFLKNFSQKITSNEFRMKVNKDSKSISLRFDFEIDEQTEVMQLVGRLYKSSNQQVGIDWQKVSGSDIWFSAIIKALNMRLRALA